MCTHTHVHTHARTHTQKQLYNVLAARLVTLADTSPDVMEPHPVTMSSRVMVLREKTEGCRGWMPRSAKVSQGHAPDTCRQAALLQTPGMWEWPLLLLVHTALCTMTRGRRMFWRTEAGRHGWAAHVGVSLEDSSDDSQLFQPASMTSGVRAITHLSRLIVH